MDLCYIEIYIDQLPDHHREILFELHLSMGYYQKVIFFDSRLKYFDLNLIYYEKVAH